MKSTPLIPHDLAARQLQDALRIRVGRGRRYSFADLSDATGVPARTLESYVSGATPGFHVLLSLCAVLGPSFTSAILAPCGQAAQDADSDAPEHMKVLTAMGRLMAELTKAVEDGHVDHREAATLGPMAAELREMLQPIEQAEGSTVLPIRVNVE